MKLGRRGTTQDFDMTDISPFCDAKALLRLMSLMKLHTLLNLSGSHNEF